MKSVPCGTGDIPCGYDIRCAGEIRHWRMRNGFYGVPSGVLNQTTSRFENVTPVVLFNREKAFSKRHGDARRSVSLSLFARASGANHRRRPWVAFRYPRDQKSLLCTVERKRVSKNPKKELKICKKNGIMSFKAFFSRGFANGMLSCGTPKNRAPYV